jgi:hypothetical protein
LQRFVRKFADNLGEPILAHERDLVAAKQAIVLNSRGAPFRRGGFDHKALRIISIVAIGRQLDHHGMALSLVEFVSLHDHDGALLAASETARRQLWRC